MSDFFLVTIDDRVYHEKHGSKVLGPNEKGWLKIELVPPIPSRAYHLGGPLREAILGPRYEGQALWPKFSEWPFIANLAIPKAGGDWDTGPWSILDIVELTSE